MEVHRELGMGFKEAVYKDALEFEFKNLEIPFKRERPYTIRYKGKTLPRKYFADFVVFDSVILEVKATPVIINRMANPQLPESLRNQVGYNSQFW